MFGKIVSTTVVMLAFMVQAVPAMALNTNNLNNPINWETSTTSCTKIQPGGIEYTATADDVVQVIVKGGPDRAVYTDAPFTDLTAPVNPKNKHNKTYGISHVIVCVGETSDETDVDTPTDNTPSNNDNNNDNDHKNDNKQDKPNHNSKTKVTICHATASTTNPYVVITVDENAVDGEAADHGNKADHFGEHKGPIFPERGDDGKWGDIIPPVDGSHNGLNWTAEGQEIYENDCNPVDTDEPEDPQEPQDPQDPQDPETPDEEDETDEQTPGGNGGGTVESDTDEPQVLGETSPTSLPTTGYSAVIASLLLTVMVAAPTYLASRKLQ